MYVDVVCLCNNGNVWDACVLASTVALINSKFVTELNNNTFLHNYIARVPAVNTDVESPVVSISSHSSLKLGTVPLAATFAIFKYDTIIIILYCYSTHFLALAINERI